MSGCLLPLDEVARRIAGGQVLLVAGSADLLRQLPSGTWIGGSVPYRETGDEGAVPRDLLHVTQLPEDLREVTAKVYDATSVRDVYADLAGRDFGVIIIPASSPTHLEFALHAPGYRGFAVRPLVGWISGSQLDGPEGELASVFCGATGEEVHDGAVVLQVSLPPGQVADVGVVNIFEQGDGEVIAFPRDGFDVTTAVVDGMERNFSDFVREKGLDTRLPLVADYYGVMVNVSFQAVDPVGRLVRFYSPVFAGLTYRHARPVGDYAARLEAQTPSALPGRLVFSCTCILNHFYAESRRRGARGLRGPLTFGEVAYQLVNQTTVYLTVNDLPADPADRSGSGAAGRTGTAGTAQA
ncbi:MAG TPA: hypothetical protein VFP72_08135 [Kineosporiaceae bacterium]|nr:hypothetical protein [Kineosporiaceae bacterium]